MHKVLSLFWSIAVLLSGLYLSVTGIYTIFTTAGICLEGMVFLFIGTIAVMIAIDELGKIY